MTIPAPGQIWLEIDGDRFVKVTSFTRTEIKIVSVKKNALGDWQRVPRARDARIRPDHFTTEFEFVEES